MLELIQKLPILIAPVILMLFTMITAYVLKFNIKRSGLGFDYIVFSVLVLVCLYMGGVI